MSAPERDHVEGELRHRNDLARDVARAYSKYPKSVRAFAGDELADALDRLAAAYLPDNPPP